MFSIFKKKKVVPHVRLTGIIGSAGKFKQGMELANQRDILKKAFAVKKITHVAISINSPGGSPVQSHLIYSYIRQLAEKNKVKVIIFAEDIIAICINFIELTFLISHLVPNSVSPFNLTDTLTSALNEPSCILPSHVPKYLIIDLNFFI